MAMTVTVISGTPGTGKSTLSELLKEKGHMVTNIFEFAEEHNLIDSFDETRDSFVIDDDKLFETLEGFLTNGDGHIIIEGHYADIVPTQFVEHCFVLTTPMHQLRERLEERKYHEQKIEENVQAEIMKVCWIDAVEAYGPEKVSEIKNDDNTRLEDLANIIHNSIS